MEFTNTSKKRSFQDVDKVSEMNSFEPLGNCNFESMYETVPMLRDQDMIENEHIDAKRFCLRQDDKEGREKQAICLEDLDHKIEGIFLSLY